MCKKVCKYCDKLDFYDWYYCSEQNVTGKGENDWHLDDINDTTCDKFVQRQGRFWSYEGADF